MLFKFAFINKMSGHGSSCWIMNVFWLVAGTEIMMREQPKKRSSTNMSSSLKKLEWETRIYVLIGEGVEQEYCPGHRITLVTGVLAVLLALWLSNISLHHIKQNSFDMTAKGSFALVYTEPDGQNSLRGEKRSASSF